MENKGSANSKAIGCILMIIIFGAIFILVLNTCSDDEKPVEVKREQINTPQQINTSQQRMLAYSYAESFIKQKLKSPSTAKFPGVFEKNEHVSFQDTNVYLINSWVDSQNGFGAIIRSNFKCQITFRNDSIFADKMELY